MGEAVKQATQSRVLAVVTFVGSVATWLSSRLADPRPFGPADWAHLVTIGCSVLVGSVLTNPTREDA